MAHLIISFLTALLLVSQAYTFGGNIFSQAHKFLPLDIPKNAEKVSGNANIALKDLSKTTGLT